MKKIGATLAGGFFLYNIIPTFIMQKISKHVIKKTNEAGVLLTFDDGPNPAYTGELLDLLNKYKIKAMFYVVAQKAAQHPEFIQRMHREGHVIGIHHHTHTSSFLLSPFQLKKQLQKSQEILQHMIGEPVLFYRPPYGHFNASTAWIAKEYYLMTWSGMFGDWRSKTAQNSLLQNLHHHVADGRIYVLHDCGKNFGANEEAPHFMLQALSQFLNDAKEQGIILTDAQAWAKKYRQDKSTLPS
ncbi:MAG: polysaccharide deacetylase family protein [Kurthia sp.]|nr:polysaccharide deacetylase family protein [Candidatus Kurthia equi]